MREISEILSDIEKLKKELDDTLYSIQHKCDDCGEICNVKRLQNSIERLKDEVYLRQESPYTLKSFDEYESIILALYKHSKPFRDFVIDMITSKKKNLTERESAILTARFANKLTLENVGSAFKITRERVRQVESKALVKMGKAISVEENKKTEKYKILLEEINLPINIRVDTNDSGLSVRAKNCLARAGMINTEDVVNAVLDGSILRFRNLGFGTANEIYGWLESQSVPDSVLKLLKMRIESYYNTETGCVK